MTTTRDTLGIELSNYMSLTLRNTLWDNVWRGTNVYNNLMVDIWFMITHNNIRRETRQISDSIRNDILKINKKKRNR